MNIGLLTDAPYHNLALMKISAWHKAMGDTVWLNTPLYGADKVYASILYEKTDYRKWFYDEIGGIGFNPVVKLTDEIENMIPDYDLYGLDYSLGYTYKHCSRGCSFCNVKLQHNSKDHKSIWTFHDPKLNKICLLNNNTFQDDKWMETFQEIWDADLTVIDQNGYDLRLIDNEKAQALKKTKFQGQIHFAWDRMQDEKEVLHGLEMLKKYKIQGSVYVLIGFDTTEEQDIYRCQKIIDNGCTPYIMPFNQSRSEKRFKRFIDSFMWRKYKTISEAFNNYKR